MHDVVDRDLGPGWIFTQSHMDSIRASLVPQRKLRSEWVTDCADSTDGADRTNSEEDSSLAQIGKWVPAVGSGSPDPTLGPTAGLQPSHFRPNQGCWLLG